MAADFAKGLMEDVENMRPGEGEEGTSIDPSPLDYPDDQAMAEAFETPMVAEEAGVAEEAEEGSVMDESE